jgi:hypothetical protein
MILETIRNKYYERKAMKRYAEFKRNQYEAILRCNSTSEITRSMAF